MRFVCQKDKLSEAVIHSRLDQLGLNDPIHIQLKDFFLKLFQGDLGQSARYRVGADIVDIIAEKGSYLVFAEVKTRKSGAAVSASGHPFGIIYPAARSRSVRGKFLWSRI